MASAFEAAGRPVPAEIRLKSAEQMLEVDFGDGSRARYSAEYLRVMSPSAEVQGHGPSSRVTVPGKRNVKITGIDPVGTYAVRLTFDDGHDTGLYSWEFLYNHINKHDEAWKNYLRELEMLGMSRDR